MLFIDLFAKHREGVVMDNPTEDVVVLTQGRFMKIGVTFLLPLLYMLFVIPHLAWMALSGTSTAWKTAGVVVLAGLLIMTILLSLLTVRAIVLAGDKLIVIRHSTERQYTLGDLIRWESETKKNGTSITLLMRDNRRVVIHSGQQNALEAEKWLRKKGFMASGKNAERSNQQA